MICEIMYNKNHAQFESIVMEKDMQGKTRAYFSNNKEVYTAMYDGRKISNSNIYIETTHSANTICDIVSILFRKYRIPYAALQIYLKADYTPLHQAETESKPDNNRSVTTKIDSKSSTKSNPDDYRFIKDSYVKQSDLAMNGLSQRMGTPSHTESTIKKKPVIKVIPKNDIKLCPVCKIGTKKESLIVNYLENEKNKRNLLTSYHCEVCKSSYIPDSLYHTYTAHKDKNNIDVEFVMEQVAQQ